MEAVAEMTQILPPKPWKKENVGTSIRLPADLLERIDEIAEEAGYGNRGRSEVIELFLTWAIAQHELEKKKEAELARKK